eukprot:s88_g15.t1
MELNNSFVVKLPGLLMLSLFLMRRRRRKLQNTISHISHLHRGVNFASLIALNRIHIQPNVTRAQAPIAQSALILVLLLEVKMTTRHVDFLFMTSRPVLCMLCQLLRSVASIYCICAQSFAGFSPPARSGSLDFIRVASPARLRPLLASWALPDLNREPQIPVRTGGPQPRAPDYSGHCRKYQPDLNRELQIPVRTAAPQPRAPNRSGQCRTSTASPRAQWALPDLNREPQIPVGAAGLEPPDRIPERMSVRRLPNAWDMQMIAEMEACPWQFGYASLGSQLVLAKRIAAPPILSLPPAKPRDLDAEAVMNIPPTPDENTAPSSPRMVGPPKSSAPVASGAELDETIGALAEAGSLPDQVGLGAPSTPPVEPAPVTPPDVSSSPSATLSSGHADAAMPTSTAGISHGHDANDDGGDRPSKHQHISAVFGGEHEDDLHATFFEESEIEGLETCDYGLDNEPDEDVNISFDDSAVSCDEMLKQLTVPYTTLEPDLPPSELLKLDMIADELEIKRLKDVGVLIPAEGCDGKVPKRLRTRMVRAWRDKFIDGKHVWLRRSRYVAREFAWLTPDRQDSSVLTVRLLPTLVMKWKSDGYVLSAIDITDAFLMVP